MDLITYFLVIITFREYSHNLGKLRASETMGLSLKSIVYENQNMTDIENVTRTVQSDNYDVVFLCTTELTEQAVLDIADKSRQVQFVVTSPTSSLNPRLASNVNYIFGHLYQASFLYVSLHFNVKTNMLIIFYACRQNISLDI